MEKEIINDENMIAFCGLYCPACGKFQKEKCQGCQKNEKASWCEIRKCCMTNGYKSCADCTQYKDVRDCKKYNNFISKIFGFIFNSDRASCIDMVKEGGYKKFADYMVANKWQSIKKK